MKGNEYAQAFETGFPATRRFLLSRGAAIEEAEEIAQAAWVRGWEFRDQLRDPGLVAFWVNSIARNLFRARFRARVMAPMDGVEAPYLMNLEEIELHRLLERCSGRDRQLLERSLEGYSAEEIARDEGITSTGIRVRLLRIRQSLRQRLALAPVCEPHCASGPAAAPLGAGY
jgi:DNA-directed RNA polymerase specialized sigma24 family protein